MLANDIIIIYKPNNLKNKFTYKVGTININKLVVSLFKCQLKNKKDKVCTICQKNY